MPSSRRLTSPDRFHPPVSAFEFFPEPSGTEEPADPPQRSHPPCFMPAESARLPPPLSPFFSAALPPKAPGLRSFIFPPLPTAEGFRCRLGSRSLPCGRRQLSDFGPSWPVTPPGQVPLLRLAPLISPAPVGLRGQFSRRCQTHGKFELDPLYR